MKFIVDQKIFDQFPEYIVPVIVATIDQSHYTPEEISLSPDLSHPNFTAWTQAFIRAGIPENAKPSHVALAQRMQRGDTLPTILPIVDFLNQVSLQYSIPIGAHDLDKVSGDIVVRPTTTADIFIPRGTDTQEKVDPDIFAYTSDDRVLTKNWIWRQGDTSAVSKESRHVFIPIDQLSTESDEHVAQVTEEIAKQLQERFKATTQIFFVSKSNPSCEWNEKEVFSPEELHARELLSRGVAQILPAKDSLASLMTKKKIRLYLGIDPTGNQLHLGHAVVLRKLNQFATAGHDVILLIGNGTVRIGDPTGRDSTRPVLTDAEIESNFETWKEQASKILDFSKIRIMRNGDWLDKLTYTDIVKLMAQTTVQQLIERDMFQDRIKKELPIFGHEIMYPLLQGFDSVAMDVDLELGGTDQTFNMMMGRHLQKIYNNHEKWVLTTPIINGTDGRKMSKSFGNFVSLTENPNDMFGKLMSITDDLIIEYFTLLTDVSMDEIQGMRAAMDQGSNPMEFKKKLAFTITADLHGEDEARTAQEHFEKTVQQGEVTEAVPLSVATGQTILEIISAAKPEMSKSEIRRLVEQGGVELAGKKVTDATQIPEISGGDILRVGKRNYFSLSL
jgi:tyrosyl-tRNA synthetase